MTKRLVLASASKNRLSLLQQIGIIPDAVKPANIVEDARKGELPRDLALRLAIAKAQFVEDNGYVLAADTVICVGRRVLPKPKSREEASKTLSQLSGRSHRAYTGIAVKHPDGKIASRLIQAHVKFKRLEQTELEHYIESREWEGCAGAYAIQGLAGAFVRQLTGSYSAVVGLPLYETLSLLKGLGWSDRH